MLGKAATFHFTIDTSPTTQVIVSLQQTHLNSSHIHISQHHQSLFKLPSDFCKFKLNFLKVTNFIKLLDQLVLQIVIGSDWIRLMKSKINFLILCDSTARDVWLLWSFRKLFYHMKTFYPQLLYSSRNIIKLSKTDITRERILFK